MLIFLGSRLFEGGPIRNRKIYTEKKLRSGSLKVDGSTQQFSQELFQGLLESAPDGIIIADSCGNIMLVNSQTEKMFGFQRKDLIGQPIEILVPDRYQTHHATGSTSRILIWASLKSSPMSSSLLHKRSDCPCAGLRFSMGRPIPILRLQVGFTLPRMS